MIEYLNEFNEVYDKTYDAVVKYVVCKCNNIDDVNDIIQDIYIALYPYSHGVFAEGRPRAQL